MPDAATVKFPGIDRVLSASIALHHGVAPAGMTILAEEQPLDRLQEEGDLEILWQGRTQVTLKNCKIDSVTLSEQRQLQIVLLDRRWKWRFGEISGRYNLRDPDPAFAVAGLDRLLVTTARTPRQLASLLLDAMGEQSYDVNALPEGPRPYVDWDAANPADELRRLCDDNGCAVCLGTDDGVKIVKLGQGQELPRPDALSYSLGFDALERPKTIKIRTARTLVQADLPLTPIAKDTDGSIVKVDAVSYKPAAGWAQTDITQMSHITDEKTRRLALEWVYRAYAIQFPVSIGGLQFGPDDIDLQSVQAVKETEPGTGAVEPRPAVVWGTFWRYYNGQYKNTKASGDVGFFLPLDYDAATELQVAPVSFTLRADGLRFAIFINGRQKTSAGPVVHFSEAVHRMTADADGSFNRRAAALLYLRTGFYARNSNGGFLRDEFEYDAGGKQNTKPKIILREDLRSTRIQTSNDQMQELGLIDNKADLRQQADYYAASELAALAPRQPQQVRYHGIRDVQLDGLLQAVSWSVSGTGVPSTTISRGQDLGTPTTLPFKQRNRRDDLDRLRRVRFLR